MSEDNRQKSRIVFDDNALFCPPGFIPEHIKADLIGAFKEAVAAAYEDAAKIAEKYRDSEGENDGPVAYCACDLIVDAIRAKAKETANGVAK